MTLRLFVPKILARFGYRTVLLTNTLLMGALIVAFSSIGTGTPKWHIVALSAIYGFLSSTQYTSINSLAYADVSDRQSSRASSIASTVQQLSLSFGVATASLLAGLFVPDRSHAGQLQILQGIHKALLVMGGMTVLSSLVFAQLHRGDGAAMTGRPAEH
ncbi:MAG: hypothetical protein JNK87_34010 [Bryobacterales bacterium]|nr:hypothetical protein [Bryobacterales bacterium]